VLKTLKNKTLASLKSKYFLFCRNFYKFSSKIIYFFNFSENENFHENYHLYKKNYIEKLGDISNCQKFIIPMWQGLAENIKADFINNFNISFLENKVIRRTMFLDYGGSALQKMEINNLEKIFDINLSEIIFEPLQTYHYRYYYNAVIGDKINKIFGPFSELINKVFGRISLYLLVHTKLPQKIKGHSIMAVFEKL